MYLHLIHRALDRLLDLLDYSDCRLAVDQPHAVTSVILIILIKRISRAPICHTRWKHRALKWHRWTGDRSNIDQDVTSSAVTARKTRVGACDISVAAGFLVFMIGID